MHFYVWNIDWISERLDTCRAVISVLWPFQKKADFGLLQPESNYFIAVQPVKAGANIQPAHIPVKVFRSRHGLELC